MSLNKYFLAVAMVLFSVSVFSQGKQMKKQKKMIEKQEVEKEKAQEDSINEGKKRHLNIQTKEVKKRIKKNARRDKRRHKRKGKKKTFFLFRIFS